MKHTLTSLLVASLGAFSVQAGVVLTDNFNSYPDGPVVGAPNSPWVNHSGTEGTLQVTEGQLRVSSSGSEDANAPLAGAPYTVAEYTGALYASYTLKMMALPNAGGAYFAHFKEDNTFGFGARIWVSTTDAATASPVPEGKFRLAIGNGTGSTAVNGQIPQDLDTNVTYTVVAKYVPSTGLATIWLNPAAETDPGTEDPVTAPNPLNIVSFAFRQAGGMGTMLIDDLVVGTAFGDVAGENRPPSVSPIGAQGVPANTATAAIPFTVEDDLTPAADLVISATSTNTVLVPEGNIIISLGDTNRTVTVTPAAGVQGRTLITVSVTDGVHITTSSFLLTVGAPTISAVENQRTPVNTASAEIPFTVGDNESPASALTVTASSSNPDLFPEGGLVVAGTGAERTVRATPATDLSGSAVITLVVSDGDFTAESRFTVTVFRLLGVQLNEPFTYADGPLYLNVNPGSGASWAHHSGEFGEVTVVGGEVELSRTLTEDVNINLSNQPFNIGDGIVLYSSFTLRALELPSQNGDYFAHFRDAGTGFRGRVFVTRAEAADGKFRVGLANAGGAPNVIFPQDLDLETTHTIVTRYDVGTGIGTLWVNPANESGGVTAADNPGPTVINTFALRQSSGIGTLRLDNLVVGTAFADVASSVAVPVLSGLSLVGGEVRIDFMGGPGDAAGDFSLHAADTVDGVFGPAAGANVTALGAGSFRATAPATGDMRFFLIRR